MIIPFDFCTGIPGISPYCKNPCVACRGLAHNAELQEEKQAMETVEVTTPQGDADVPKLPWRLERRGAWLIIVCNEGDLVAETYGEYYEEKAGFIVDAVNRVEAAERECVSLRNALKIKTRVAEHRAKRLESLGVKINMVYPATEHVTEQSNEGIYREDEASLVDAIQRAEAAEAKAKDSMEALMSMSDERDTYRERAWEAEAKYEKLNQASNGMMLAYEQLSEENNRLREAIALVSARAIEYEDYYSPNSYERSQFRDIRHMIETLLGNMEAKQ